MKKRKYLEPTNQQYILLVPVARVIANLIEDRHHTALVCMFIDEDLNIYDAIDAADGVKRRFRPRDTNFIYYSIPYSLRSALVRFGNET
jgi:hypothetical protein